MYNSNFGSYIEQMKILVYCRICVYTGCPPQEATASYWSTFIGTSCLYCLILIIYTSEKDGSMANLFIHSSNVLNTAEQLLLEYLDQPKSKTSMKCKIFYCQLKSPKSKKSSLNQKTKGHCLTLPASPTANP